MRTRQESEPFPADGAGISSTIRSHLRQKIDITQTTLDPVRELLNPTIPTKPNPIMILKTLLASFLVALTVSHTAAAGLLPRAFPRITTLTPTPTTTSEDQTLTPTGTVTWTSRRLAERSEGEGKGKTWCADPWADMFMDGCMRGSYFDYRKHSEAETEKHCRAVYNCYAA